MCARARALRGLMRWWRARVCLCVQQWRETMVAQNRNEQEMGRKRTRDGDQAKNLEFYKASMPQKKK